MMLHQMRKGRRPQKRAGAGHYHVRTWEDHVILDGFGPTLEDAISNLRALWFEEMAHATPLKAGGNQA